MKINSGSINALYVNNYKPSENFKANNNNLVKEKTKDSIELSSLGKSLNKLVIEDETVGVSSEAVEMIKSKITAGTYTVDSKVLAKSMVTSMKGGQ